MASPLQQIGKAFEETDTALMPYFTLGYPDYETSLEVIAACAAAGADLIELGVPFSDPLADGPTIQHSSQVAIDNGITPQKCLAAVAELRDRGVETPFMLMGYFNPILAFGEEDYVRAAAEAGANGFIIPDLPPEEAGGMVSLCTAYDLGLSFLLAPNSTSERIRSVVQVSTGFTYLVSVTGITGARTDLPPLLAEFVARVRPHTEAPLAVGFGISTPEQAAQVGRVADGVIVGSALIKTVSTAIKNGSVPESAAHEFVQALKAGITGRGLG